MKKSALILLSVVFIGTIFAQTVLRIYKSDQTVLGLPVSTIDSILFPNESILRVYKTDQTQSELVLSTIDSLSIGELVSDTVTITYTGASVIVDNPMANLGVMVYASGADVVVNSTITDKKVNYLLKGTSTNGSFKVYSIYRIDLILSGVTLTNSDGPAINIQTKKRCEVTLDAGTTNTLTDGSTYASSSEDQKGTFFSEGQLIFEGSGVLTVNGNAKNGIVADDYIEVNSGTINLNVTPIASKGLKCSGLLSLNGGDLNIKMTGAVLLEASGLGFDPSYCTGIKCDTTIKFAGSNVVITSTGLGGKGISSDKDILLTGGTVKVTTSGNGATYTNTLGVKDAYSAACISVDGGLSIMDGALTCTSSGSGGKGLKANGSIVLGTTLQSPLVNLTTSGAKFTVSTSTSTGGGPGGGTIYNYCHPKTMLSDVAIVINNGTVAINSSDDGVKSETSITINGGTTTISNSTEGIEAKVITMNGGRVYVTASDDGINTTASTQAGGTESNDGSYLYMNGGLLTAVAGSGDAIDSNGNILMTGGVMVGFGPSNTTNEDIDGNGSITINGGLYFGGCMNSGMFESIASSTQVGVNLKSSSAVSTANGYFQIKDASGTEIGTFKTPRAFYYFHLSSPSMKTSTTYSIYTGGTYTGTTTGGYCTGGTCSGGTLKKSFTTSTSKVSTVSI